jgi:hypothetical protein
VGVRLPTRAGADAPKGARRAGPVEGRRDGEVRVIVTGSEYPGGLAAIRDLRRAGLSPWAAVTTPDAYGARSRAAAGTVRVPEPRVDPRGFAIALARAASRLRAAAVLPGTEPGLLALAEHEASFPPTTAVGTGSAEEVRRAVDKETFGSMAAGAGFDVPPTQRVRASDRAVIERLCHPAVVKPPRSELVVNGRLQRFESRRVEHPRELAEAVVALPGGVALVQPYLDGPIVTVNGVAWRGDVVAAVHQVGMRIWPEQAGALCYAKTTPPDLELDRLTRELMGGMRWSGLFNLQLIDFGGSRYAIDLNPRTYQSQALATAAGVNLTAIWTELLLGGRPEVNGYRAGVWFRSEEDARAILRLLRTGQAGEALRALVPRRRTAHNVFSVRDPGPTATLARRMTRSALGGTRRVWQNRWPWPPPRPRR